MIFRVTLGVELYRVLALTDARAPCACRRGSRPALPRRARRGVRTGGQRTMRDRHRVVVVVRTYGEAPICICMGRSENYWGVVWMIRVLREEDGAAWPHARNAKLLLE